MNKNEMSANAYDKLMRMVAEKKAKYGQQIAQTASKDKPA